MKLHTRRGGAAFAFGAAALVLVAVWVAATFRYPLVLDDPFITYRYARNLLDGNGFVFNPGEHILSTTAPLYALLLALLGRAGADIPTAGFVTSAAGFAVCAVLLARLGAREGHWGGFLGGLLVLVAPSLVLTLGLETGFYLALALSAITACAAGRVRLAFVLLALLTLTRPDGALLAVILGTHWVWRTSPARGCPASRLSFRGCASRRGIPSNSAPGFSLDGTAPGDVPLARHGMTVFLDSPRVIPFLLYALILFPFLAASWWWFGAPAPSTLSAKITQAQSGLWPAFGPGLAAWAIQFARDNLVMSLLACVGLGAAVRKAIRNVPAIETGERTTGRNVQGISNGSSPLLLLVTWGALHATAYTLLGVAFYPWYIAPVLVAWLALAGWGAGAIGRRRPGWALVAGGAIAVGFGAAAVWGNVTQLEASGMDRPQPKAVVYRQAAEWLAQNASPEATVDALEVGLIGYYDARRTVDFVGLVAPKRLPYLKVGALADSVRSVQAEYVVAIPPDEWLGVDAWFAEAYRPVQRVTQPGFYSARPLVIYRRVDVGVPMVRRATPVQFEHGVSLDAVELPPEPLHAGERIPLALTFREGETLPFESKLTIQLVDDQGATLAQRDTRAPLRLPADGAPFRDLHSLVLPPLPPGSYRLLIAFYDPGTGDRLSTLDTNGGETGDSVSVAVSVR